MSERTLVLMIRSAVGRQTANPNLLPNLLIVLADEVQL